MRHDVDTPYCFNRKEKKQHGEGGSLVGAELKGKVPIMDNVTIQVDDYVATLTLHPVSQSQSSGIGVASQSDKEQFKK